MLASEALSAVELIRPRGPGCNWCPRLGTIPDQQRSLCQEPWERGEGPTDQEVEDGHVDNVEQPVTAVVRVDLLHCVTVQRIDLPPEGENQSWGWKSQDGKVLGALLTLKSLPP